MISIVHDSFANSIRGIPIHSSKQIQTPQSGDAPMPGDYLRQERLQFNSNVQHHVDCNLRQFIKICFLFSPEKALGEKSSIPETCLQRFFLEIQAIKTPGSYRF